VGRQAPLREMLVLLGASPTSISQRLALLGLLQAATRASNLVKLPHTQTATHHQEENVPFEVGQPP
jgi:hypothetical protein